MVLCFSVDDMVIITNDRDLSNKAISKIKEKFDTKIVNDYNQKKINNHHILGLRNRIF